MPKKTIDVEQFKNDLRDLLNKYDVIIGADIDGDTHGITNNFVVADKFHGDTIAVLSWYTSYISAYDLRDDDGEDDSEDY